MAGHNPVRYDEISRVYDRVRQPEVDLIRHLLEAAILPVPARVLDIGCGTGTHADLIQRESQAHVYGIDLSAGMLARARAKNPQVRFTQGNAEHLPFASGWFDLVYMTDVVHHVPHIDRMFGEIARVLAWRGKVCIVTQSHAQIENRPIAGFFPGTATVDKARYPEIEQIVAAATGQGLAFLRTEVHGAGDSVTLDRGFLDLVQHKGYSMLHLISEEEYQRGLDRLAARLAQGDLAAERAGETLVWFEKVSSSINSPPGPTRAG